MIWSYHGDLYNMIYLSRLLWMLLWIIQKRYFKWEVSILCPHNTAHFNQSGMNDYSSILKNNWNTQCNEKWSKKVERLKFDSFLWSSFPRLWVFWVFWKGIVILNVKTSDLIPSTLRMKASALLELPPFQQAFCGFAEAGG